MKRVAPANTRGAARRAPGDRRGLPWRGSGRELFAEAGDDEQRVVDPQRQAHHRADDHREGFDRHHRVEEDEDAATGDDGERAEGQRDRGRHDRAEDEQEDDEQKRRRDQLGALGRSQRFLLQGARDAGVTGLDRFDRRVDPFCEGAFERRHGVAHGDVERQVVVEQDDRPAGAGTQIGDGAAVPGGDGGQPRIAAQRPDQRRALPFDRAARSPKQDRKRRGVPEVLFGESLAAGGGRCPARSGRSARACLRRRVRRCREPRSRSGRRQGRRRPCEASPHPGSPPWRTQSTSPSP